MDNAFIRKMEIGAELTDADREKLREISEQSKLFDSRSDVIRQGTRPSDVHLVLEGMAIRYKSLPDGGQSIMAVLLPGDFCDLHVAILDRMDHTIATLSPCRIALISYQTIADLSAHHPRIIRAMWWATLVDEGVLREWLVNLGQRPADQRIAHFFCEVFVRMDAIGLARENAIDMPLTQAELGDLMGLSTVHVNRSIQSLRQAGLLQWESKTITFPDVERMMSYAEFDPAYLHLKRRQPNGN